MFENGYGIFELIASRYGVNLVQLAATGAIVSLVVAGVKALVPGVTGAVTLPIVGALSFGVSWLAYQPEWITTAAAATVIFACAVGGWFGASKLMKRDVTR